MWKHDASTRIFCWEFHLQKLKKNSKKTLYENNCLEESSGKPGFIWLENIINQIIFYKCIS